MWKYVIGGIATVAGLLGIIELEDIGKKEIKKDEKKIWNHGICKKCGHRWNWRYFYKHVDHGSPDRWVALDCPNCHRHKELRYFNPKKHE